ncbi:hypothetical protein [Anabaena sp. UHCC 0399]|uniref:hypothetical protein n=1 Tax=Anabaena sp. UHCC 0399 TaxID=3110238 RepID=UPI002B213344|nr:hypothetical protein [Anabaena sp. UHCC 0399]MEA5567716.1 hypothetical protein [Anabaena sp. UHCC 0399]
MSINNLQIRDVSEAKLVPITEEEYANWLRGKGTRIIKHRGRYWQESYPGFFQPVHLLARLSYEQATAPQIFNWGFQTTLDTNDAAFANGVLPIHLLSEIENYDLQSLSANRRGQIRKSHKLVKFVELTGPKLLQEQGHEVLASALKRTNYGNLKNYLADIANLDFQHWFVMGGLIEGKLGAFMTAYAIDNTAYMHTLHIATEALSTCISPGLHFEFVQMCRRSGKIREIAHSLHSREDSALCTFKDGMRFGVQRIPSKVEINPIIAKFIQKRYPNKYYRLTGQD